jgi:hypothetical protein
MSGYALGSGFRVQVRVVNVYRIFYQASTSFVCVIVFVP